ncbi:1,3-beta-glucan synthase regulator [Capnocytophaga stomatis]|uniref:1,3-beta-glucan synthase regulator n=1 Tax=Capnocytophaga stomatis TaxID=1848904 RepID=A0A250FVT2_9FLAO|nr:SMI1/KNR4 family protein [Capnocytophaga stomatis]ATA89174.1 1,3-beta-glucan synthase regulator [Capnocytophaga stomatis]
MNSKLFENINQLISKSKGEMIRYGSDKYRFELKRLVSEEEIIRFEEQHNITFPNDYKEFLLSVGACTLFETKYGLGLNFLPPDEIFDWSRQVFEGTGVDLFPSFLIIGSADGHPMGFLTQKQENNFGIFYADIPPEYWEEDTDLMNFNDWLNDLMQELA